MEKNNDSQLLLLIQSLEAAIPFSQKSYQQIVKRFVKNDGRIFAKNEIISAYRKLYAASLDAEEQKIFVDALRMKPVRTQSGVAPITVLTKPFPCPGTCIFCPNDIRMPKSYLADEPGAQRAERNYFDPYLQTYNRLLALHEIGHAVDKAEIIVLGGTWSFYPEHYQIWFIKECFRALNEFMNSHDRSHIEAEYENRINQLADVHKPALTNNPQHNKKIFADKEIDGTRLQKSYNTVVSELYVGPEKIAGLDAYQTATWEELELQQKQNETGKIRCVGLVIETRPDAISEQEVLRVRRLGCTKTQIGVQSLQDSVLAKNKRGHTVAETRKAFRLLRQAGFKIHAHWMANLYGSSVEKDKEDFLQLFSDPDFCPDELKIYPCSLIGSAELMQYFRDGKWKPYLHEELLDVVSFALSNTPEYCRLTRVIRDIPSTDIVTGNKITNFRELAEKNVQRAGVQARDIRAREIKHMSYLYEDLELRDVTYTTTVSEEHFLQYCLKDSDKIVAFLRLSLPQKNSFCDEIKKSALIREVHVYGKLVSIGASNAKNSQHKGLGTRLMHHAAQLAHQSGFTTLSVISAVGTREYYRSRGFTDGALYQHQELPTLG